MKREGETLPPRNAAAGIYLATALPKRRVLVVYFGRPPWLGLQWWFWFVGKYGLEP